MTTPLPRNNTFLSLLNEDNELSNPTLRIAYPADLLSKKSHFIELAVLNHLSSLELGDRGRGSGGVERGRHSVASMYLPIPEGFSEGISEQKFDVDASVLDGIVGTAGGLLGRENTVNAVGRGIGLALALSQTAPNPGYYVKYERPTFREYDLSWMFVPRNEDESKIIHNICRWLKFYSAPAKKGATDNGADGRSIGQGLTFSYPNEFRMRFLFSPDGSSAEDIFLPRPQTGYISSLEINHFAEDGTPTGFFKGKKYPVVTVIKLTYLESEFMYKNDFADFEIYEEMAAQQLPAFDSDGESVPRSFETLGQGDESFGDVVSNWFRGRRP